MTIPPDRAAEINRCEARAEDAEIAFQPTKAMIVGEQAVVQIVASLEPFVTLPSLPGSDPITTAQAPLGCFVEARISGGEQFSIDPTGWQERSFLGADQVSFEWLVTPKEDGVSRLEAVVRGVVVDPRNGARVSTAGKSFVATITVTAQPESVWEASKRWSAEVVDHPLVRGAGSLAAFVGVLLAMWRWVLKRPWPWRKRSTRTKPDVDAPHDMD